MTNNGHLSERKDLAFEMKRLRKHIRTTDNPEARRRLQELLAIDKRRADIMQRTRKVKNLLKKRLMRCQQNKLTD